MRTPVALAALVLLAACGGKDGGGNNSSDSAGAAPVEPPANLTVDPYNSAVPVTPPSPAAVAAIPARFAGRWGMGAADCDPAKADGAKGLMVVAPTRISFYESRGLPQHLARIGDDVVTFELAMSGEGQQWREPTRLTLRRDGRVLTRQAQGDANRRGAFTYQRCPA